MQSYFLLRKEENNKILALTPEVGKRMLFKSDDIPVGICELIMEAKDFFRHIKY